MSMIAKKIVKNKFWTLEQNGRKIGFIESTPRGIIINKPKNKQELFKTFKELEKKYGVKTVDDSNENKDNFNVNGFLTGSIAYNKVFDIRRKLPLYTKTSKSKSYYCAGFYLVKYEDTWNEVFNPKLILVNRTAYRGPFLTSEEAKQQAIIENNLILQEFIDK